MTNWALCSGFLRYSVSYISSLLYSHRSRSDEVPYMALSWCDFWFLSVYERSQNLDSAFSGASSPQVVFSQKIQSLGRPEFHVPPRCIVKY